MVISDIKDFFEASKSAVELLKSAYAGLPSGGSRDEIEEKVRIAEDILARSDAKLAKELGYNLCRCTYPPQIMLWSEAKKAMICPNQQCGKTVRANFDRISRPRGPHSWMG